MVDSVRTASSTSPELALAFERELDAKRQYANRTKELLAARATTARKNQVQMNQQSASEVREYKRVAGGRHSFDVQPASEEEVARLAKRMTERMDYVFPDPASRAWYAMFKVVDVDGSGMIKYTELVAMVREHLRLSSFMLPDAELQAVWRALDNDDSGFLTAGEFGVFMCVTPRPAGGGG